MSTFGDIAYETAMAYVLPGGLAYVPVILYLHYYTKLDLSSPLFVLVSLAISAALGVIINMAGHVLFDKWLPWKQMRKEKHYFGNDGQGNYLEKLIKDHYPEVDDLQVKIELVDAIFMGHVSDHIFYRRNWEWDFHKASRNLLLASPFLGAGLISIMYLQTRSLSMCLIILVCVIIADMIFYQYMEWSILKYYDYPVNTVCSHLVSLAKHPDQPQEQS